MAEAADTDILIIGAGPVGLTLARSLAGQRFRVTLVERRSLAAGQQDPRAIALAHGARQLLAPLGVWPDGVATPIERIHISQRGGFGRCLMTAAEQGLPALGYVVRYGDLLGALASGIDALPGIVVLESCQVESVTAADQSLSVRLRQAGRHLEVRPALVVHAEGAPAGDGAERITLDYAQQAIVAEADSAEGHGGRAWERFTSEGPLAVLPLARGHAIVLTVPAAQAAALLALSDNDFLAALQTRFGDDLHFTACGPRAVFPLTLCLRRRLADRRQVWIGNAAQTLHPVSGQGFNLGLRDAHVLSEAIWRGGADPGAPVNLAAYATRRRLDRMGTAAFTDGIVRLFSNDFAPLKQARGLGLAALDLLPPARAFVARRMIWGARAWP